MKKLISVLLLFILSYPLLAQKAIENPELKRKTEENWVRAADYMSEKNYSQAVESLHWIMTNVPDYFAGVYIHAYKAYEQLGMTEADKSRKQVLLDSMLISYRLKEKHFNLSVREKNNLAFKYYKHFRNDASRFGDAMKAYAEVYSQPEKVVNVNIVSYMFMAARYKESGNVLSKDQLFEIYGKISEVIRQRKEVGIDSKKLDTYQGLVDDYFFSTLEGIDSCEFLSETLGPNLTKNEDVNKAKRMFTMMLNLECTDNPYFKETAIIIWTKGDEKTGGLAKLIAGIFLKEKNYPKAIYWFKNALEVSSGQEEQAKIQMDLARTYLLNNDYLKARTAAEMVINLGKELNSEACSFLGNLYMGSFDDCKKELSHTKDRAVFMLAFEMFEKAKNIEGMKNAKSQFPTKSQVFTENYEEGQKIEIECWIQRTTIIRARASN